MISNGAIGPTDPVGTVTNVNTSGGERGLLGIAVDPQWPARPYIYTHSTHTGSPSRIRISRFTLSGDLAGTGNRTLAMDAASRYDLVTSIPDNANNHNGGTVRFGPDGMLYVSLGEDAQPCAAQDTSSLRGVILRLDVTRLPEGPGGPPPAALITPAGNPFPNGSLNARVIWAYGLRNPFRFHIDPVTGALFIADVGQDSWEEADFAPQAGMNFGWPIREGNAAYNGACAAVGSLTAPILAFDHDEGSSVMSAGVYRRPPTSRNGFPLGYEGDYFCSDYYTGFMWRMKRTGTAWAVAPAVPGQPSSTHWGSGFETVSDYLVGADGALWYCSQSGGQVRRVVSTTADTMAPAATVLSESTEPGPEQ
jgi:glucose/arabinose dehydrogenase